MKSIFNRIKHKYFQGIIEDILFNIEDIIEERSRAIFELEDFDDGIHFCELENFWREDYTEFTQGIKNIFNELDKVCNRQIGEEDAIKFLAEYSKKYLEENFWDIKDLYDI